MVCIDRSKSVEDKEVWVYIKGELGRANAEIVRLDANLGLLIKCNDTVGLQYQELTVTNTTRKRKDRQLHTDHWQSLFCAGFHRPMLLLNV